MKNSEIILILDNIRSAHNVGSIFRTADAAGVAKIYLCGYTPKPVFSINNQVLSINQKIRKTALGAEETVPWEHVSQTWRLVEKLKERGVFVVALEQDKRSENIFNFKPRWPLALIVGNEVTGINTALLNRVEKIIAIPQYGEKESLNVSVAIGVALYTLTRRL